MTFDPNASLDPGQVTDRRGMGRAGVPIVGGGLGLIVDPRLRAARRESERPRADPGTRRRHRSRELRARDRLPDRRGCERPRRLPRARLRQQRPGVLERRVRRLRADVRAGRHRPVLRRHLQWLRHGIRGDRTVLLPARPARLHRSRLLRRAAKPLRRPVAGRWPRATSSRTSTATTSRTCSAR